MYERTDPIERDSRLWWRRHPSLRWSGDDRDGGATWWADNEEEPEDGPEDRAGFPANWEVILGDDEALLERTAAMFGGRPAVQAAAPGAERSDRTNSTSPDSASSITAATYRSFDGGRWQANAFRTCHSLCPFVCWPPRRSFLGKSHERREPQFRVELSHEQQAAVEAMLSGVRAGKSLQTLGGYAGPRRRRSSERWC